MRVSCLAVLTTLLMFAQTSVVAENSGIGNLGYNSFEGYVAGGAPLVKLMGPGVGYPSPSGDIFHRYLAARQWGRYGYGTGHLGEGWGPYIFPDSKGGTPPGMFDPLPSAYRSAPPPRIKIKRGTIIVSVADWVPGIRCVTVTLVAFNNADLAEAKSGSPPFQFSFPVMDGVKNVRVRIDYNNENYSSTSYPL